MFWCITDSPSFQKIRHFIFFKFIYWKWLESCVWQHFCIIILFVMCFSYFLTILWCISSGPVSLCLLLCMFILVYSQLLISFDIFLSHIILGIFFYIAFSWDLLSILIWESILIYKFTSFAFLFEMSIFCVYIWAHTL